MESLLMSLLAAEYSGRVRIPFTEHVETMVRESMPTETPLVVHSLDVQIK